MSDTTRHLEIGFDQVGVDQRDRDNKLPLKLAAINFIEPHYGREIGLMKAGLKPCAIIHRDPWHQHGWFDACKEHNWIYEVSEINNDVFIAVSGERWRLTALQSVHRDGQTYQWRDQHVEAVGRLLGYSQEDVDAFVELLKKPEVEQTKIYRKRWQSSRAIKDQHDDS